MVGVLKLDLYLPGSHSLKAKRQVLRGMVNRIAQEFKVSVTEVGDGNIWQRTRLGIATVGRARSGVTNKFQEVKDWIEQNRQVEIIDEEEEIISF